MWLDSRPDRGNNSYYRFLWLIAGDRRGCLPGLSVKSQPSSFQVENLRRSLEVQYQFNDAGLNDLRYADADARAMRDFLLKPEGGASKPRTLFTWRIAAPRLKQCATPSRVAAAGRSERSGFCLHCFARIADPFDPRKLTSS